MASEISVYRLRQCKICLLACPAWLCIQQLVPSVAYVRQTHMKTDQTHPRPNEHLLQKKCGKKHHPHDHGVVLEYLLLSDKKTAIKCFMARRVAGDTAHGQACLC